MKSCIKLSPISLALFSVFSTQTFAEETNTEALAPTRCHRRRHLSRFKRCACQHQHCE